MVLDITLYANGKEAHIHFSYHTIHILRDYASQMVGGKDEDSEVARREFPNLVWHNDAEGYYVGWLPDDWKLEAHIHVGSVEGLYKELQRIATHMLQTKYEGNAKKILQYLLDLFVQVGYDVEENCGDAFIEFS